MLPVCTAWRWPIHDLDQVRYARAACTAPDQDHGLAGRRGLETARLGCDLIYMALHGWDHDDGRLLGSVTLRVLNASPVPVPVLVHKSNVLVSHPPGAQCE